jgi:hypothetical protein
MKPFDEQFSEKVREVFDNHKEPFNPDAWKALASRMQGRRKGGLIAFAVGRPWMSAAAALLIMAVGVLLWQSLFQGSKYGTQETAQYLPEADEAGREAFVGREAEIPEATPAVTHEPAAERPALAAAPVKQYADKPPKAVADQTKLISPDKPVEIAGLAELAAADTTPVVLYPYETRGREETTLFREPEAFTEAFPDRASPLSWDVSAGPMLTYVEQQLAGGMGFAGGVTGQWKISGQLALTSGMLLAYQQFSVNDMPMPVRYSGDAAQPENVRAEVVANHDYEMISLDFPVNVRWQLSENRRHGMFLSAGFSSLLFLQQNVTGQTTAYVKETYASPGLGSSIERSYSTTADISASYQAFNHFDFARLLNLSFGYAMKRDHGTMVIEPFLKLPLGEISSRELKMGMGGVVMRYQFGKLD